jgi:hypothetical protein
MHIHTNAHRLTHRHKDTHQIALFSDAIVVLSQIDLHIHTHMSIHVYTYKYTRASIQMRLGTHLRFASPACRHVFDTIKQRPEAFLHMYTYVYVYVYVCMYSCMRLFYYM